MQYEQNIEELLLQGKNIRVSPQGYSMYPVLVPERDQVVIEPIAGVKVKRGDVVLYRRTPDAGGILVLHRVWKCTAEGIYLVGDNQTEIEGPLQKEQIKGIMVGIQREEKFLSVTHPLYRLCTGGWLLVRPFRRYFMKVAACIKQLLKKVK